MGELLTSHDLYQLQQTYILNFINKIFRFTKSQKAQPQLRQRNIFMCVCMYVCTCVHVCARVCVCACICAQTRSTSGVLNHSSPYLFRQYRSLILKLTDCARLATDTSLFCLALLKKKTNHITFNHEIKTQVSSISSSGFSILKGFRITLAYHLRCIQQAELSHLNFWSVYPIIAQMPGKLALDFVHNKFHTTENIFLTTFTIILTNCLKKKTINLLTKIQNIKKIQNISFQYSIMKVE